MNGFDMDLWGGSPADLCTSNAFYGCERQSGAGGNYLNPVQARLRVSSWIGVRVKECGCLAVCPDSHRGVIHVQVRPCGGERKAAKG